jgi:hypothetical protein
MNKELRLLNKLAFLVIFAVILFSTNIGHAQEPPQAEWDGVGRVVAIGDIHGTYDKLIPLLKGTGMVDDELRWLGGTDHLVFVGDLVDRGQKDRAVIELLMRLQDEARSDSGQVHALLGNHDVMVLVGDLRYVHKKSYDDFAADEDPADREKAYKKYKSSYASQGIKEPKIRAAFDENFPVGFFSLQRRLDLQGTYGKWLMTCPAIIKINGVVYVHGGLTRKVASLGIEEINRKLKEDIMNFVKHSKTLESLAQGPATFEEIMGIAAAIKGGSYIRGKNRRHELAAKELIELLDSFILSSEGPIWYRGNSLENERIEREEFEKVLELLEAHTMVVGHTPTGRGRVRSRFNKRLYRIDVGKVYGRKPYCIVFDGQEASEYNPEKHAYENINAENPQGQEFTSIQQQLPDIQMEEFLEKAEVKKITQFEPGKGLTPNIVELEGEGLHIRAIFATVDEKPPKGKKDREVRLRKYKHEVAAYKIDRMLGLNMVPPCVIRKIGKQQGAVEEWVEAAVDLGWIDEQNMRDQVLEGLQEEVEKGLIFSALIDVERRLDQAIMFLMQEGRIMLTDNTKSFSHFPEIQERFLTQEPYISYLKSPMSPALEVALRSLERKELRAELKKLLSNDQIDALLKRRDHLLELFVKNQP